MKNILNQIFLKGWILKLFIVFLSLFCISQGDNLQEKLSPRNYWIAKQIEIEKSLKQDVYQIEKARIELDKQKVLADYEIKEASILAKIQGKNLDFALVKKAQEEKVLSLEKDLHSLSSHYQRKQVELSFAKEKANLYQQ